MTGFSRTAWVAFLLIIGGVALVMLMPLGVAANALGISARHSQGTILSGALRDASLGRMKIGDVNARLQILPLFTGHIGFVLTRGDSAYVPGVSGAVGSGVGGIFADKLTATVNGGEAVRGLEGSEIRFESLSFAFSNRSCKSASGVVRLSLDETAFGSVLRGGMIGNAECRNGDLFLSLMSQSTMEKALVRIKANGDYQLTFTISDPTAENAAALALAGFEPVAGGLRLVRSGKLN
jgi:general secretion pathway protein N